MLFARSRKAAGALLGCMTIIVSAAAPSAAGPVEDMQNEISVRAADTLPGISSERATRTQSTPLIIAMHLDDNGNLKAVRLYRSDDAADIALLLLDQTQDTVTCLGEFITGQTYERLSAQLQTFEFANTHILTSDACSADYDFEFTTNASIIDLGHQALGALPQEVQEQQPGPYVQASQDVDLYGPEYGLHGPGSRLVYRHEGFLTAIQRSTGLRSTSSDCRQYYATQLSQAFLPPDAPTNFVETKCTESLNARVTAP